MIFETEKRKILSLRNGEIKMEQILSYCKPHLDKMWAASIVGIILECDFRDTKQELEKYRKDN